MPFFSMLRCLRKNRPYFFDRFPRFYETSHSGLDKIWLEARYQMLIEAQQHLIKDKIVADFACHDGRWSLAALDKGASKVLAIEPDDHLLGLTRENFKHYQINSDKIEFISQDAVECVRSGELKADTVFLFGFLTLLPNMPEFFVRLSQTKVSAIVIDVQVHSSRKPTLMLRRVASGKINQAAPNETFLNANTMGMIPSVLGLKLMLEHAGFRSRTMSWKKMKCKVPAEFRSGKRVVIVAER
jgi:precorrin-6B methylase 2